MQLKREDLPDNAKRLLTAVDKHSYQEIALWVREAVEAAPKEDRKAISYVKKKSWGSLVADIDSRIKSQDYSKIHELPQIFFALGNVDRPGQLSMLMVMNEIAKDPKMEAYIFYRYFGGRPKVKTGLFEKI